MTLQLDVVAGTRPNFVKIAPILRALRAAGLGARLVHTGQHYDASLSEVFFRQLEIPEPDVRLGVGSGPQGAQTGRILEAYEALLLKGPRPDGVVVVGDVNSTLACTLAAVKLGVRVAHVEAGLRSFDRTMPEELNRIATDQLADLLLASEPAGVANLEREGIAKDRIRLVGNVMIDTLFRELPKAEKVELGPILGGPGPHVLVTLHRPSNVDDAGRLRSLMDLLVTLSKKARIVFPVHPRTRERLKALEWGGGGERLRILDPLGYHESMAVMRSAAAVITDSGGMQDETAVLGVPCFTMRSNTERPVTLSEGTSVLIGDDAGRLPGLLDGALQAGPRKARSIPLWDGKTAGRIVGEISKAWSALSG